MIEFFSEEFDVLPDEALPREVQEAASELRKAGYEVTGLDAESGFLGHGPILRVKVDVKRPSRPQLVDIQRQEYVLFGDWLSYPAAPPAVRFDRFDFPRSLPHVNQTRRTSPVWPCLTLESLSSWFQGRTIVDLARRVERWLGDAASGRLMRGDEETFERIFMPPEREYVVAGRLHVGPSAFVTASAEAALREITSLEGREKPGVYRARYFPLHAPANPYPPVFSLDAVLPMGARWADSDVRFDFFGAIRSGIHRTVGAPGLLILLEETSVHVGPPPEDLDGLGEWCSAMGSPDILDAVRACFTAWEQIRFVIVTFLVPRPRPIAGNVTRRPEVDCVSVVLDAEGWIVPGLNLAPLSRSQLAHYSGAETSFERPLLVGGGAMGSKFALNYVRSTGSDLDVVDPDVMLEHNVVRHALARHHIGLPKAVGLVDELRRMFSDFRGNAYFTTLQTALNDGLIDPSQYDLVVDATAAPGMPFVYSYFAELPRVFSLFSIPGGALGIGALEGADRNPRMDDLEGVVFALAADRQDVSQWLEHRYRSHVPVGGCGDLSAVISDDVLSLHAARFARLVRDVKAEEAGAVWLHSDDGHLDRIEVPKTSVLHNDGWSIRVSGPARQMIFDMLERHKPTEVAGYLHGVRDIYRREILVSHASVEPLIVQSEAEVEIDTSVYENPARGALEYLGTWHTHPNGGIGTSSQDEATVSRLTDIPVLRRPLLFLIAAPDGQLGAHLRG